MCTSWNSFAQGRFSVRIITYWEMCTSWNTITLNINANQIITYWEMCTSWNLMLPPSAQSVHYNLLGNVH